MDKNDPFYMSPARRQMLTVQRIYDRIDGIYRLGQFGIFKWTNDNGGKMPHRVNGRRFNQGTVWATGRSSANPITEILMMMKAQWQEKI